MIVVAAYFPWSEGILNLSLRTIYVQSFYH
jgi:hypothetical protein